MRIKLILLVVSCVCLGACSSSDSTESLNPTPTPTLACEMHTASMMLAASVTMLEVGETITVTVTLSNEGCVALGMPQYWLGVECAEEESIFDPSQPQSVVHYLAVPPGQFDMAEFVLRAVESGQATLAASASFEVHLGYPGPAYWAGSSTKEPPVVIVKP
jgi:hypothetical protein